MKALLARINPYQCNCARDDGLRNKTPCESVPSEGGDDHLTNPNLERAEPTRQQKPPIFSACSQLPWLLPSSTLILRAVSQTTGISLHALFIHVFERAGQAARGDGLAAAAAYRQ